MGVIHNKAAIKRLRDGTAAAVADLQDQIDNLDPGGGLSVTVTDITDDLETLPEGVTATRANLQKYGNICMLSFAATNSGEEVVGDILYIVPSDICPYDTEAFLTSNNDLWIEEDLDNGGYDVFFAVGAGNTISGALFWIANPAPAPEPEPGE